jgi:hypothetical protein
MNERVDLPATFKGLVMGIAHQRVETQHEPRSGATEKIARPLPHGHSWPLPARLWRVKARHLMPGENARRKTPSVSPVQRDSSASPATSSIIPHA